MQMCSAGAHDTIGTMARLGRGLKLRCSDPADFSALRVFSLPYNQN